MQRMQSFLKDPEFGLTYQIADCRSDTVETAENKKKSNTGQHKQVS